MKLYKVLFLLILMILIAGCSFTGYGYDEGRNVVQSEVYEDITINVGNRTQGTSRSVDITAIESVDITVRSEDGSVVFARKSPAYSMDAESFSFTTPIPINTTILIEAIGYDSFGAMNAYGKRTVQVALNETADAALTMSLYQPVRMPTAKMTAISTPSSVTKNGMIEISLSGYVLEEDWPTDPDGDYFTSLNLDFNAKMNSSSVTIDTRQLLYSDLTGGRAYFTSSFSIPGDSSPEAEITLETELSPGGTVVNSYIIPQIPTINSFDACPDPDPAIDTIHLSWTSEDTVLGTEGNWTCGALIRYTTIDNGYGETEVTEGTGFDHTYLIDDGRVYDYTITPFTTNGSATYYGSSLTTSAALADQTPPSPPSDFSATVDQSGNVSLSWTNPGDSDFYAVKVMRSTSGYPASITDGVQIGSTTHNYASDVVGSGTYYYSVFARDLAGNYSTRAVCSLQYAPAITGSTVSVPYGNGTWFFTGTLPSTTYSLWYSHSSTSYHTKYADFYVFYLSKTRRVTIGLDGYYGSTNYDTYLYLYSGTSPSYGGYITRNDDSGYNGYGLNSYITETLTPGYYCIAASHYGRLRSGDYRISITK